jgi:hypothetical protein
MSDNFSVLIDVVVASVPFPCPTRGTESGVRCGVGEFFGTPGFPLSWEKMATPEIKTVKIIKAMFIIFIL